MKDSASRQSRSDRLAKALSKMVQATELSLERAARQGKLHPTDLRCLAMLLSVGRQMTVKEILSGLGLTSGSGTALFDRLEKLGYIHRLANPIDRRGVLIEIDPIKAKHPLEVLAELSAKYRTITDRFSDAEIDVIAEYLEAVSTLMPSSALLLKQPAT